VVKLGGRDESLSPPNLELAWASEWLSFLKPKGWN